MKIELEEKDVHCVAWFMLSTIRKSDPLFGCMFCRYQDECTAAIKRHEPIHGVVLRERMREAAGINAAALDAGSGD